MIRHRCHLRQGTVIFDRIRIVAQQYIAAIELRKPAAVMWISSFVITFSADLKHVQTAMDALQAVPEFDTGDLIGTRLPVVLEASDGATARDWHNWVESLPGVVCVDVAFVSFEEPEFQESGSRDSSRTFRRHTASEADAPLNVQSPPATE